MTRSVHARKRLSSSDHYWLFAGLVFAAVFLIYTPFILHGPFILDDFHFIRHYSAKELATVWFGNWDLTGRESDGYRPLAIWTFHVLHAILGFRDVPFMFVVSVLNAVFGLFTYRLARHILKTPYAVAVGILAPIWPQTLFHFTWATEIPAKMSFLGMLLGCDYLIRWLKTNEGKFLRNALISGVVASFCKETGYGFLMLIPLVVFIETAVQQKLRVFAKLVRSPLFWVSAALPVVFVTLRHFALLHGASPEYYQRHAATANEFFKGLKFVQMLFFRPFYESYMEVSMNANNVGGFFLVATIFTLASLIISERQKRPWGTVVARTEICLLILSRILTNYSSDAWLPKFTLLVDGLMSKGFYVLLIVMVAEQWKRDPAVVVIALLEAFSLIPLTFMILNRLMPVPHTLALILVVAFAQFLLEPLQFEKYSFRMFALCALLGTWVVVFAFRALFYIGIENNRHAPVNTRNFKIVGTSDEWVALNKKFHLEEQQAYANENYAKYSLDAENFSKAGYVSVLSNGSFENGLTGWQGPDDCSAGAAGAAVFDAGLVPNALDGKTALRLTSENHILCYATSSDKLKMNGIYAFSFDAKNVEGDSQPEVALDGSSYGPIYSTTQPLDNGWVKHFYFISGRGVPLTFHLYASPKGKKTTNLYANFQLITSNKQESFWTIRSLTPAPDWTQFRVLRTERS